MATPGERIANLAAKATEKAKAMRDEKNAIWMRTKDVAPDVAAHAAELRRVFRSPPGTKDDAMTRIIRLEIGDEVVFDTPDARDHIQLTELNKKRAEANMTNITYRDQRKP